MDRGAWWATVHGWQRATKSLSRHTRIERDQGRRDFKEFTHTFVEIHGTAIVLAQRRSNF